MKIKASLKSSQGQNTIRLQTNDNEHSIDIPARSTGYGSSANGGELLFLALATCYCNDIYREAARKGIQVEQVEVEVDGEFGGEGEPARGIRYQAKITAQATEEELQSLMLHTDQVAEIQNTLRSGLPVKLVSMEAVTQE